MLKIPQVKPVFVWAKFCLAITVALQALAALGASIPLDDSNPIQMPSVGSVQLRVLSPTLLELFLLNSKDPDPARVTSWDFVDANFGLTLPLASEFQVTAAGQSIPVQQVGFKRRPLYAPLKHRDLRIANYLYLILASPVPDNASVQVQNPNGRLWTPDVQFNTSFDAMQLSPAIHVNEVGYAPGSVKKAMVGYFLGSLGEMTIPVANGFELADTKSGAVVFRGTLTTRMDQGYTYSPLPYQQVYEADFSAFQTPGEYRLRVPGLGASFAFTIDDGTMANFTRAYALGLYHQRCGGPNEFPFTRHIHDACHIAPADVPDMSYTFTQQVLADVSSDYASNPRHTAPQLKDVNSSLYPFVNTGKIDVSKGHHDAGDYSKYTINSAGLIHYLVFAADAFPGVAALDNLGIPESGDGKSDILQEAKWEADFLAKMQDADGGFYFLVYPRDRCYEDTVLPDHGDPQVVWPKTTAVTAAATAALAEIASSPTFKQQYPAEAQAYLDKALKGWAFLQDAIARFGKDGSYQKLTHYGNEFMHDDELAWAAAALFVATGDAAYQSKLIEWYTPSDSNTRRWTWWRLFEAYGCAARTYAFAARSGRLPAAALDSNYLTLCQNEIMAAADDSVRFSNENAYGTSFPDPYKPFRSAGWYFSSERAFDLTVAYQLDPRPAYRDAVIANMNYEAGGNPLNVSYITGLGWKRQREIVHQYAQNDRRVLPPSGIPLGNIQGGSPFLDLYQGELTAVAFPADNAASAPYPYYDRWADTFNTTTEFVIVDAARSLASLSFWMAQTPLKSQAWRSAAGQIVGLPLEVPAEQSITLSLSSDGVDLSHAVIVWEATDQEPFIGPSFTFAPKTPGAQWVEAEAELPDGRRVFASGSFNATTSLNIAPNSFESAPQTVTSDTVALFHFDSNYADATARNGSMTPAGQVTLDASNLGWMAGHSGAALKAADLGDDATLVIPAGAVRDQDTTAIELEAMMFINGFKGYARGNAQILSLNENWNCFMELSEDMWAGPMIRGGNTFSFSGAALTSALTLKTWHHLKIHLDAQGYEFRIDGNLLASGASSEFQNWGYSPVTLQVGNFDGWLDELVVKNVKSAAVAPSPASAPVFSPDGGTFSNSVTVTLSSATDGAVIHYTLDGSQPDANAPVYSGGLQLTANATISAIALKDGLTPSSIVTRSFIVQKAAVAKAAFVTTDVTTQGNWKGYYGTEGYNIIGNVAADPSYAAVTPAGASTYWWSDSTTDARALLKADASDRLASCWYAVPDFGIDFHFSDTQTHRVGLYFLDWDRLGRVQTIDVIDSATGTILDTQTLSAFQEGKYLIWDLQGDVRFRLTCVTGPNAVVAGIFFGINTAPAVVSAPAFSPAGGTYIGSVNLTLSSATANAVIRYTTDGSLPTAASPIYTGTITIKQSKTIRAQAFKSGLQDSAVTSASYTIKKH